jgi:hypothetical protein
MEGSCNYKDGGETGGKFHCVEFRQAGLHRLGGKLPDTAVFWDIVSRSLLLRYKHLAAACLRRNVGAWISNVTASHPRQRSNLYGFRHENRELYLYHVPFLRKQTFEHCTLLW